LQAWLKLGYQADMEWMANPSVKILFGDAGGAIGYLCRFELLHPHQRPNQPEYAKISRYGWGDYHKVLHKS